MNVGDWIAFTDRQIGFNRSENDGIYEVESIGSGGLSLTVVGDFSAEDPAGTEIMLWKSQGNMDSTSAGMPRFNNHLIIPSGTDCPATCAVGEVFMDTDTSTDTNCTSSIDGAVCGCHTADTWGCP